MEQSRGPAPFANFDALARAAEEAISVCVGAALIAKDVYERLDVEALVTRIGRPSSGRSMEGRCRACHSRYAGAEVARRFRDSASAGAVENYTDAKNSLLPDVVERRIGIPITLTRRLVPIAARAERRARGVGFRATSSRGWTSFPP